MCMNARYDPRLSSDGSGLDLWLRPLAEFQRLSIASTSSAVLQVRQDYVALLHDPDSLSHVQSHHEHSGNGEVLD